MAPIIGIGIFIILIVLDIIGHKKLQVKRKLMDWGFLCLFVLGLGIFIFTGLTQAFPGYKDGINGKYLAYKYLMDGEADNARAVILQDSTLSDETKKFMNMLAFAVDDDYERLYFATEELLSEHSIFNNQEGITRELNTIAMNAIIDGKKQKKPVEELVSRSFAAANIPETAELLSYYTVDSKVKSGKANEVKESEINALLTSFEDEQSVKKLAVSYYVQIEDFEKAKKAGENLVKSKRSEENQIIFTDVYAQQMYSMSEKEIKKLDDKEIGTALVKSEEAARAVVYSRIENYIKVKKPFFKDTKGLYDLQLVKMEILKGNTDTAFDNLMELVGRASSLKDSSPVKGVLLNLLADIEKYNLKHEEMYEAILFEDCEALLSAHGQDVISVHSDTINAKVAKDLASYIIYDIKLFEVTQVDSYSYPKVSVTAKMNLKKQNILGMKSEFYKDDFKLMEDGVEITDYTLAPKINSNDRTIVAAVDFDFGTEEMLPDVQTTLKYMAASDYSDKFAVIDGAGDEICKIGNSEKECIAAIKEFDFEGDASSFDILTKACDVLTEKKYEDRVLVVISDNLKLEEYERNTLLKTIRENNIVCYIITMGDADVEDANVLAKESGGMTYGIVKSEELKALANQLKKLLNNSYVFTYKSSNEALTEHSIEIELIPEEITARASYVQEVES